MSLSKQQATDKFAKRNGRSIIVDGVHWKYVVGRNSTKANCVGHSLCAPNWQVRGDADPAQFERGQWKRTSDGMVRPERVANWIRQCFGHDVPNR